MDCLMKIDTGNNSIWDEIENPEKINQTWTPILLIRVTYILQ